MTSKTDMIHGSITPTIFSYCLPLIAGSVLLVFFNMADQIVLGQMAGSVALASVGACSNIVGLIINFFVGLSGGVNVVLSHAIGRGDMPESKKIVATTFLTSIAVGIAAVGIALPAARPLLEVTNCPADCFDGALTYSLIYFSGIPVMTLYNFCAAALRVSGDSKRPTFYIVLAGALNLLLNVSLCFVMSDKVAAVAIATVVSQCLAAFLTVKRLIRMDEEYRLEPKTVFACFSRKILLKIMRYGIPSGFCSSLYNIANLQLQRGINSFGTDAIAGHSAASGIESLVSPVVGGFATTALTMVGQNVGAGRPDRVRKSILYNLCYAICISTVLCLIVWFFKVPLIRLYVPQSPGAIEYAVTRMRFVLLWFGVNAYFSVIANVLNAYGYSVFVMISNFLTTIVFRTVWMQLIYPRFGTFSMIMRCYNVAWWLSAFCDTVAFIYVYRRYKKGIVRAI